MNGERALLAAGWLGLGIWVGALLTVREIWLPLIFAGLLATVVVMKIFINMYEWLDAARHGGRKREQCRVVMKSSLDSSYCRAETRDGGAYGLYCVEHLAIVEETQRHRSEADEPVRWGPYRLARDGSLRWGDYTLYKAAKEGELFPL